MLFVKKEKRKEDKKEIKYSKKKKISLTLKRLGGWVEGGVRGVLTPCIFSKSVSSRERVKPVFCDFQYYHKSHLF